MTQHHRDRVSIRIGTLLAAISIVGTTCAWGVEVGCNASSRSKVFFVSGVLRKLTTPRDQGPPEVAAEIKLIHAVITAATQSDAYIVFYRSSLSQYPGYEMASVLATNETAIDCANSTAYLSL